MKSSLQYFYSHKTEYKIKFKNNSKTNKMKMNNISLIDIMV